MRKFLSLFVLIFIAGFILTETGEAAEESPSRIILYTYYRQMGWGDRIQIGSVDEKGVVRTLIGYDSSLKWPYKPKEQLEYLSNTENFTAGNTLEPADLYSIESLIKFTEDQGSKSLPAACDAGTEKSYAVRYSDDGEPVIILLGMSGDDYFENFDPNAQAFYLLLRRMFPGVTSYAYGPMGPQGFDPVPFAEFTGLDAETVMNSEIRSGYIDCEAGYIPRDLTAEGKTAMEALFLSGMVTGKADCLKSDADIYTYAFYDPDGNLIGMVDFEEGLLVHSDGRYYFGIPDLSDGR